MNPPTNFFEKYIAEEEPDFYVLFLPRFEAFESRYGRGHSLVRDLSVFFFNELYKLPDPTSHLTGWLVTEPKDEMRPEQWLSNFHIHILPFLKNKWT